MMFIIGKRAKQMGAAPRPLTLSSNPFVHPNIDEARREAERLAAANLNHEFVILQAMEVAAATASPVQFTPVAG
jgi:hypothetical protein